jgi:hypothetical protein
MGSAGAAGGNVASWYIESVVDPWEVRWEDGGTHLAVMVVDGRDSCPIYLTLRSEDEAGQDGPGHAALRSLVGKRVRIVIEDLSA